MTSSTSKMSCATSAHRYSSSRLSLRHPSRQSSSLKSPPSSTSSNLQHLIPITFLLLLLSIQVSSSPLTSSSSLPPLTCPGPRWRNFNNEKCLLLHSPQIDYESAFLSCQSIGAELVTIQSAEEETFILKSFFEQNDTESNQFSYFWLDKKSIQDRPSPSCPPTYNERLSCPAKIVSPKRTLWCYFDCNKDQVSSICQITRRDGSSTILTTSRPINKVTIYDQTAPSSSPSEMETLPSTSSSTSSPSPPTPSPVSPTSTGQTSSSEPSEPPTTIVINKKRDIVHPTTSYTCEVGWKLKDRKCYKIPSARTKGEESSGFCMLSYSAKVASIPSRDVQDFVERLIQSSPSETIRGDVLVSGHRIGQGDRFSWPDSAENTFTYNHWGGEEPAPYKKGNCLGVITQGVEFGYWRVLPCNKSFNVLCSKPAKEVLLFDTEKPEGSGDYKEVPISEPSHHHPPSSPSEPSSGSNSSGGGSTGLLEEGTRRDQEKSSKLSGLAISFIVLAAVAILILICFVFAMRRRRDTDATYNTHRISLEKSPYDDTVYVDRKSGTMVDSPTDVHSDGTSPRTITTTAEVNGTTTGANNNNTNTFGSKNTTV